MNARQAPAHRWRIGGIYLAGFLLGACVDILRHTLERVLPAVRDGRIDDAIAGRALVAVLLLATLGFGLYFGARWSGRALGARHRRGFLALFVLTPIVVYLLEH